MVFVYVDVFFHVFRPLPNVNVLICHVFLNFGLQCNMRLFDDGDVLLMLLLLSVMMTTTMVMMMTTLALYRSLLVQFQVHLEILLLYLMDH